jgi:hypothetical protein
LVDLGLEAGYFALAGRQERMRLVEGPGGQRLEELIVGVLRTMLWEK